MSCVRFTQLVTELSAHPGLGPLASSLVALARLAWRNGDVVFPRPGSPTLKSRIDVSRESAVVGEVDVLSVLETGARASDELDTLTVLVVLGVASNWPNEHRDRIELARLLLWLESYSGMRCLTAAMAVLDSDRQRQFATVLLDLLEQPGSALSNVEVAIGRAWLCSGAVDGSNDLKQRAALLPSISPPGPSGAEQSLTGDLGPRPRHPAVLALLAITGILLLARAARGLGRLALRRRTPTSVWISDRGVELFLRQEMLGRVVRERRVFVPLDEIRSVEREVRFPRFGLYSGLVALALGTFLGTRLFVDGLRVAGLSFPLMGIGLASVALGIALDVVFSGIGDTLRGHCRLIVNPRRGSGWAIGALDPSGVDRLLTELTTQWAARRQ